MYDLERSQRLPGGNINIHQIISISRFRINRRVVFIYAMMLQLLREDNGNLACAFQIVRLIDYIVISGSLI